MKALALCGLAAVATMTFLGSLTMSFLAGAACSEGIIVHKIVVANNEQNEKK